MTRLVLLVHRYAGIVLCLLVASWCLSGIGMMYVRYPSLDETGRLRGQRPLDFTGCCQTPAAADGEVPLSGFTVEMLADRPVLRLRTLLGADSTVDLRTGALLGPVSASLAGAVAATHAAALGSARPPRLLGAIDFDQWTVSGFRRHRPLYHFALDDRAGTELYVSGVTGEVVQRTAARQRFWNYFAAIPHWIYFTTLRERPAVWTQVVIWTSTVGVLLILTGLYVGWVRWLARPPGTASPYRGVALWHHLGGLLFGVITLGWMASGLLSMNPWGLLEGSGDGGERERLAALTPTTAQALAVVEALRVRGGAADRAIESAPFGGQLFLTSVGDMGDRRRLDLALQPRPLTMTELTQAAARLQPDVPIRSAGRLDAEDRYYYSHHDDAPLPVFRVIAGDAEGTRYYLDARDGALLRKVDHDARWWRWLFSAPHQWDFAAILRQRPVWDAVVVALLGGLAVLSVSGVWMAVRYVRRSLQRL